MKKEHWLFIFFLQKILWALAKKKELRKREYDEGVFVESDIFYRAIWFKWVVKDGDLGFSLTNIFILWAQLDRFTFSWSIHFLPLGSISVPSDHLGHSSSLEEVTTTKPKLDTSVLPKHFFFMTSKLRYIYLFAAT